MLNFRACTSVTLKYFIIMTFSQPVGKLSDCGCKLDCGWFASVGEERRATHRVVKPVVFEAQHDAVLVKNDVAVAFVDFITEVVAATFITVVACANLVVALCVLCTIGFGFVQCGELRNLVALNVVIVIYAVFFHNLL